MQFPGDLAVFVGNDKRQYQPHVWIQVKNREVILSETVELTQGFTQFERVLHVNTGA
jgi:hypothetical protein